MQDLEEEGYLVGLEKAKFVERLAHYYCEINVLHPFRVGSGLAQRIFFEQLAIHAGYHTSSPVSWTHHRQRNYNHPEADHLLITA